MKKINEIYPDTELKLLAKEIWKGLFAIAGRHQDWFVDYGLFYLNISKISNLVLAINKKDTIVHEYLHERGLGHSNCIDEDADKETIDRFYSSLHEPLLPGILWEVGVEMYEESNTYKLHGYADPDILSYCFKFPDTFSSRFTSPDVWKIMIKKFKSIKSLIDNGIF